MKKKFGIALAVVVGIAVLAGAAYLGVSLMAPGRVGMNPFGSLLGMGGKGVGPVMVKVQMAPAPELPTSPPDLRGRLVELKDNSLAVRAGGGGNLALGVTTSKGGGSAGGASVSAPPAATETGPTTEVVVTQDTKIYRDATMDVMSGQPPADGKIQQKVEPYSLAQAATDGVDSVTAWGAKRGDRLIADVVVLGRSVVIYQKSGTP